MNQNISIQAARDACSCNACRIRNYESSIGPAEKTTDKLYEVVIGTHVIILCKDCLNTLRQALNSQEG